MSAPSFAASMTYCRRPRLGELTHLYQSLSTQKGSAAAASPDEDYRQSTFVHCMVAVEGRVADARALPTAPSLGVEGFQLVGSPLDASFGHADERLRDDAFVRRAYYPLMERLLCGLTGAARCVCVHHRMRTNDPAVLQAGPQVAEGPAPVVHADYSHDESLHTVAHAMAQVDDDKKYARAMIVNCWRNIDAQDRPVRNHHLAMCDARSVAAPDDIVETYSVRPSEGRAAGGYSLLPEAAHRHRWLHFPAMRRDEALAFVQFDSSVAPSPVDGGPRPRYVFHTSVADPAAPAGVVRKSMELRAVLFFEHPAHPADRVPAFVPSTLGTVAEVSLASALEAAVGGMMHASVDPTTFDDGAAAEIRSALSVPFSMGHDSLIEYFIADGMRDEWLPGAAGASAARKKELTKALTKRFDDDKPLRKKFLENLKEGSKKK